MTKWTNFVKANMSREMKKTKNDHGKAMKNIGRKWKTSSKNPNRAKAFSRGKNPKSHTRKGRRHRR